MLLTNEALTRVFEFKFIEVCDVFEVVSPPNPWSEACQTYKTLANTMLPQSLGFSTSTLHAHPSLRGEWTSICWAPYVAAALEIEADLPSETVPGCPFSAIQVGDLEREPKHPATAKPGTSRD